MMDWPSLFKISLGLFAIVNPIGSVPIFISATSGWSSTERAHTARTVAFSVFIILTISSLMGDKILDFFGVSIPSFQVGGGILLMLIAISMMHGKQSGTRQTPEEAQTLAEREVIAIVPLSIPLLAGPGAISNMIIAAQKSATLLGHLSLIIPILLVCITIWLALKLSVRISNQLGSIGINVVTRLMGLILAAMAVEFIAHGLTGLFPSLA
ncbi:YchE family NAAT transporter [Methylotenera sp.]|uniref:YchE family NAAT transporter n=1 Tax=Methylotenera sp. TaxID=2051956 RepID=UPI002EDB7DCC